MNTDDYGNPIVTDTTNILDIVIPEQMKHNVRTGIAHLDQLFAGDGMTPSTVVLATGIAGTGKTTLALQLCDALKAPRTGSQKGTVPLYNTNEESLFQVKKTVDRLTLKHGFTPGYTLYVDELLERCDRIRARPENKDKQFFLVQDSLQRIKVKRPDGQRGRDMSDANMELEALKQITAWAKKTFSIAVVIGQVTKGGDFAGKNSLIHLVDCHLHLSIDTDRKSETYKQRVAEMKKNRFGCSSLYYPFQLHGNGLKFVDDADFGMAPSA